MKIRLVYSERNVCKDSKNRELQNQIVASGPTIDLKDKGTFSTEKAFYAKKGKNGLRKGI